MSIYDDLANSGYLNQEDFQKQFNQNNFQQLEESMVGSNKFVDFNQYDIESSRVNQDDHFNQDYLKIGANINLNPNYKKVFNPDLQDPFPLPSAIKSPINREVDLSQIGQRQNLFEQKHYTDESDAFLKDSTTGMPYKQPQRMLQLEDDDIIQIQHNANLEQRTGRFASHMPPLDQFTQPQLAQNSELYNNDIDRFKNQNDQIQQLLLQLQTPQFDMFAQDPKMQFNQQPPQQPLQQQRQFQQHNYQRSQSEQINYHNYVHQKMPSDIHGPTYDRLNKDNSLLELAKMQNSGNGSESAANQSAHDQNQDQIYNKNYNNISKDFSYYNQHESNMKHQRIDSNMQFQAQFNNMDYFNNNVPTNLNTVGNSMISYQKFIPPYPGMNGGRNVSEFDQENIDQNIFQMKGGLQPNPIQMPVQEKIIDQQYSNQNQIQQRQMSQQNQFQLPQAIHRQMSEIDYKRKEIMSKFDDIPIKDLNKAEGYQQKRQEEEVTDDYEKDESLLTLLEKIDHPKWKIRMNAYKEINTLFYNEYSRECLKNKGQTLDEADEDGNPIVKPFEQYGPIMHKIISDNNLVAQYEGLNCLFAFIKFSPEIKSVIFQIHTILLEKIQHNKPNFKEVTIKILLNILKKDKSLSLIPELIKRFKNKNTKIAAFSSEVIVEALRTQTVTDEQVIKQLFDKAQDNLGHSNKELREITIEMFKQIYRVCDDDISVFMKNIKNLRPVQQKDIKDILIDVEKSKSLVQLFKNQQPVAQTYTEGFSPKRNINKQQSDDEEEDKQQDGLESDLTLLVPQNFFEIPYLTQITIKKKGMEQFNAELEKLVSRRQYCQVQNKDYSQIFNVVTHMLEDSNALVFMEAIKTVEFLSLILGKNIKQQKLRQFYKETKTAPVAAVNKALQTIIKTQNIPISQLIEYMVNQLVTNSKNSRVKQLLLEKIDTTIQEESYLYEDETQLGQIFKQIKDKILGLIQKDTNASVRDAAVSLITTFKAFAPSNQSVNEAINTLPKYRISEINKIAQERGQNRPQQDTNRQNQGPQQIQKKIEKQPSNLSNNEIQDDFSYQGKNISGQYQIHLAEIILSLKRMSQTNNISLSSTQQKWDQEIENLGEIGIKESKSVIVSCVHWLFTKHNQYIIENQQIIEMILGLVKKIFCIERSIEIDQRSGKSQELEQFISIVLISLRYLSNQKQLEILLNVLLSASSQITIFMESLQKEISQFSNILREQDFIVILQFSFGWISSKLDQLLSKGMIFSDFEDMRGVALQYVNLFQEQSLKDKFVQIMVNFKNSISESRKKLEYNGEDDEDSLDHQNEQQIERDNYRLTNQNQSQQIQSSLRINQEKQLLQEEVKPKSIGQQFVELIDRDFQQGLQMIKNLQMNQSILDFENKEIIFNKIIKIVSNHVKNPVQQQQQAFSLKALLWMKEEIFGIEDCFKFTSTVMITYAQAELQGKDSSVELYLLNHWVKQLRLRDLIDRVSNACQMNEEIFRSIFTWLMMNSLNGNTDGENSWQIEDFRKISVLLARYLKDPQVIEFFNLAVEKFSHKKVKEFMEIQLMHNLMEYNSFMDWFSQKYRLYLNDANDIKKDRIKLPDINIERELDSSSQQVYQQNKRKFEDLQLKDAINTTQNNYMDESSMPSSSRNSRQATSSHGIHSKLYQQMREKRKTSNQRKNLNDAVENDSLSKYDQIINRLEAQLQGNQNNKETQQQEDSKFNFYKSSNSNYQSEKGNRYQITRNDEEDEEDQQFEEDSLISQNKKQLQQKQISPRVQQQDKQILDNPSLRNEQQNYDEQEHKLKESTMKENLWKLELEKLQLEKQRIEHERMQLLKIKDKETEEWRQKYDHMQQEHEDVISNLKEANRCYLTQVSENEDLKKQLKKVQEQNLMMMKKFEDIETKLQQQEEQQIMNKYKQQEKVVVKEQQLKLVEKVFGSIQGRGDEEIGTKKIQELLLNFDDREETQRIGLSLFVHYQQLKSQESKQKLVRSLTLALDNEDVLFALPLETYKTLLDFNLKAFSKEKAILEGKTIRGSVQSMQRGNEQNEITIEVQKLVSKLLNSKEFTTSLVTLFQILRDAMPENLAIDLTEEDKQYLKVILRCISRIAKALHSEHPDLIRAFDVLIEMQKIFLKNPPESLREDLPCLQDFDAIYRGLKDVTDKLMELQPEKVMTFLEFVKNQPQNAFIRYMNQIMQPRQSTNYGDNHEDDEEQELYEEGY